MAVLTITAANVVYQSGPIDKDQYAGEAFAAGANVYLAADGYWYKAKCNGTAVQAGSGGTGMALATADVIGARVSIARPGAIVSVGTGTAGIVYVIPRTAGSFTPSADMLSTDNVTVVALGIGSSKLLLGNIYNVGAVV